jgi:hypothetical protein
LLISFLRSLSANTPRPKPLGSVLAFNRFGGIRLRSFPLAMGEIVELQPDELSATIP